MKQMSYGGEKNSISNNNYTRGAKDIGKQQNANEYGENNQRLEREK